jgi:hypothetical protein
MSGNVWEWTSSPYEDYPYQAGDGREESTATGRCAIRGDSYYYTHYQLACTYRSPLTPEAVNSQMGLRVVFDRSMNPQGVHTLRLQVANGAHIALEGEQYRDEITVTVRSGY